MGQEDLPHLHQQVLAKSSERIRGGKEGRHCLGSLVELVEQLVEQLVVGLVVRLVGDPVLPWVEHPDLLPFLHGGRRSPNVEDCPFPFLKHGPRTLRPMVAGVTMRRRRPLLEFPEQ